MASILMRPLTRRSLVVGLATALTGFAAMAAPPPLVVMNAWTRPARRGFSGVGYMTVVNRGRRPDMLVGAESPAAASVSLHVSSEAGGVSSMRPVARLVVPPHGRVALAPGGYHLMFMGLKRDFSPGRSVPVTLIFRRAGRVRVELKVSPSFGPPPAMHM